MDQSLQEYVKFYSIKHKSRKVFRKILQSTALADEGIMGIVRIIGKYLSYLFEIYLKKMSHFTLLNG